MPSSRDCTGDPQRRARFFAARDIMRAKKASMPAWSFENLIGSETGNDVELELDDASMMFAHKVFLSRSAVFSLSCFSQIPSSSKMYLLKLRGP
jgi:hypothetical protein